MMTATAPAAWALRTCSEKEQFPLLISATLPAICSPFASWEQPVSGTATTVDAFSTSVTRDW